MIRHEEEARPRKDWRGIGFVRARRRSGKVTVRRELPRDLEQLVEEPVPPNENDSGRIETLADGSISIPKRTVLRERVVIRKVIVSQQQRVEATLRRGSTRRSSSSPSLVGVDLDVLHRLG